MFPFLFLLVITPSMTLTFDDAIISLNVLSSGNVNFTNPAIDACGKIIARNSSVHHANIHSVYQNWFKGNLQNHSSIFSSGDTILDYSVDQGESFLLLLTSAANTNRHSKIYSIDNLLQITLNSLSSQDLQASKIVTDGTQYYILTHSSPLANTFYR